MSALNKLPPRFDRSGAAESGVATDNPGVTTDKHTATADKTSTADELTETVETRA